jgi:aspartyl-tRNA(Asn)/glutamyl-tRNA(Gln) amidotransferase subunit B
MSTSTSYETVIGLEVHVQLATESKAFCGDSTAFGATPNSQVSAISLGHPGTLPRLNERQVEYAVRLALALGSEVNLHSSFDRKNYFYADLPKGYQITQDREPICWGGSLEIRVGGERKSIRIHHVHMEEDAGKSIHDQDPHYSFVDLNRAGMPLLEIVSEPDLRSPEEVDVFMNAMRRLVRYLGISDGNMQEGSLRCDCNVSVRLRGTDTYGTRCEIKNMNSMRNARRAIEYEVDRQIAILESGGTIEQQTLDFDPVTGQTSPLRDKEDAHDYRYFPEPDLVPVALDTAYVDRVRNELPPLPWELYREFTDTCGLSDYDAEILIEDRDAALLFRDLAQVADPKAAANLTINKILPWLQERQISATQFPIAVTGLRDFIALIDSGKISASAAYANLFPAYAERPDTDPETLAKELNLLQSADEDFLSGLVDTVLAEFPGKVAAYQKGKKGLLGFFMGEVMKRSKGKAEPKATNALLRERLEA